MKRILTAFAAISVLGAASLASAAGHYSYNNSYDRGGRVTSSGRVHTPMRGGYTRPAATYWRGNTYSRPVFRGNSYARWGGYLGGRYAFDYSRARVRAAAFARSTASMWARANAYSHWNYGQRLVLSRLHALDLAARSFMSWGSYVDLGAKQAELARIEAEFAALQVEGAFLAPYGSFSALANSIAEMRATLGTYAAPAAAATQVTTPYASAPTYPQPEPPADYNGGAY